MSMVSMQARSRIAMVMIHRWPWVDDAQRVSERMNFQCAAVTGVTDRRLPRRSSSMPSSAPSACSRNVASDSSGSTRCFSRMSTVYQSGLFSGLFAS